MNGLGGFWYSSIYELKKTEINHIEIARVQ